MIVPICKIEKEFSIILESEPKGGNFFRHLREMSREKEGEGRENTPTGNLHFQPAITLCDSALKDDSV